MTKILSLVAGSIAGGLTRYYMGGSIQRFCGAAFPYGTLAVNLVGCFLIGFLSAIPEGKMAMGSNARLLLMVGFCGAFTTFSAFTLETSNLLRDAAIWKAVLNVSVSVIAGLFLFRFGAFLARIVFSSF